MKSIDCPAQSINRYFAQQTSMDLLPNPWIVCSVATLHAQSSYGLNKQGFDLFWFEVIEASSLHIATSPTLATCKCM